MKKTTLTFKMPTGGMYRISFRRSSIFGGYYYMIVLEHPQCSYPIGHASHLLEGKRICVSQGREPRSIDQAKAVAFHWMKGFESYRTTGFFPNGAARFDVKSAH